MKYFIAILLSFILFESSVSAKTFEQCEFAQELFLEHLIPRDEIYKHLCIVSSLHTSRNYGGHLGIYSIGSRWWCGQGSRGGSCNVTCSDLLDDDIADDVDCANLILKQQGLEAFGTSKFHCKEVYEKKVEECLELLNILDELDAIGNTTDKDIKTTTFAITTIPTTTSVNITTTPSTTNSRSTTTTTTTRRPSLPTFRPIYKSSTTTRTTTTTESTTTLQPKATAEESIMEEEGSSLLIWVVVLLSIILSAVLMLMKFGPVRFGPKGVISMYHQRDQEFESILTE